MTTNSMNAGNEEYTDNVMNKFYEGRNEAAEKRKMDAAVREAGLTPISSTKAELEDRVLDQKTKLMACKKAGKDQETQLNALDALIATMDPTDQATKDLKKWATHAIILSQIKGLEDTHDGASNGSTIATASRGSSVASMPTNSTSTASGPPAKRPRRNSTTSTMGNQGVAATGNQVAEEEEEDSTPAARPTNVPNEIVWNDDNEADV